MKKAAVLFLALTILGAAGLAWAHCAVSASAEAVELRETVLAGDRAAAAGVEVQFPTKCMGHMYWDTSLSVGAENTVRTQFRYESAGETRRASSDSYGANLKVMVNFGGQGASTLSETGGLERAVLETAGRTDPGTQNTELVYLNDYCEFMPMLADVHLPEAAAKNMGTDFNIEEMERELAELFRIPVPEDWQVEVSVAKYGDGEIKSYSVYPAQDCAPETDCMSVVTDSGLWLAVQTDFGGDTRFECAAENGLYFMPFEQGGEITPVLELAGGEHMERLEPDEAGEGVLLLTSRDGGLHLNAYGARGQFTQSTRIMSLGAEEGARRLYVGEGFIAVISGEGRFVLAEHTEDGEYVPCIHGELYEPGNGLLYSMNKIKMLWDGERLTVAAEVYTLNQPHVTERLNGFLLWVYDRDGLAFCARYDSSLCLTGDFEYIYPRDVQLNGGLSLSLS